MNRAHILIGRQLTTYVCQLFTCQKQVYQHEKVGEKVGKNRGKFYLSPTVCQLEFANTSLPTLVGRVKAALGNLEMRSFNFYCTFEKFVIGFLPNKREV